MLYTPSSELLQSEREIAGLNIYAESLNVTDRERSTHLIKQLSSAITPDRQLEQRPDGFLVGEVDLILSSHAYSTEIDRRAELIWRYHNLEFDIAVAALRDRIIAGHAEMLGPGEYSKAYALDHLGEKFSVRFPRANPRGLQGLNTYMYIGALWRGIGRPNLEQVAAYDLKDDVVVSWRGPGRFSYDPDVTSSVSDQSLYDLSLAMDTLDEIDCVPDMHSRNVLYDRQRGFTVIDYSVDSYGIRHGNPHSSLYKPLDLFLMNSRNVLAEYLFRTYSWSEATQSMANLKEVASRYVEICRERVPNVLPPEGYI